MSSQKTRRPASRRRVWRFTALAFGVALLGWAGVALQNELAVGRYARAARRSISAGRFDEAREPLERWLRANPNDPEAHFLKARVALAKGDAKEISEQLRLAVKLGYSRAEIDRLDAIVKVRLGQYADAKPLLEHLFQTSSKPDPELYEALARIYLQTYELTNAQKVLERWIRDAPNDPTPYLWFTEIDSRTTADSTVLQEEHFRAALERNPNLDKARLGLAELLRKARRNTEAAEQFTLYLARNPHDVTACVGAALCAKGNDDEEAAIGFLNRALAVAPDDPSALKERAGIDQRHGQYATALARLDRALKADPFDTETLYARSQVLARLGRLEDSRADQRRMEQIKAEQAQLLKIRDALVESPDNIALRSQVARWMFDHGRDEEGLRWTNYVLSLRPDYRPANLMLAEYYQRKGDIGRANYYRFRAGSTSATESP
jgi:tetratricopeptide (TPR) repeat protein